jgi:fructose-1,6-bisphosphatase I
LAIPGRYRALDTLTTSAWRGHPQFDGLDVVIQAIAKGSQEVHKKVQGATLAGVIGSTGATNVHDEVVQHLDIASSNIFVEALFQCGRVAAIGCEEIEKPVLTGTKTLPSYIVLMDPLDGSSNIDVAVSIGSIFGIWCSPNTGPITENSLLLPGDEQIAAAYIVYGSSTIMVVATRDGVQGFTLDPDSNVFALTHPIIMIPEECPYYSINESNSRNLSQSAQQAVDELRNEHSLRYVGSLVADFHRNLIKGGIFLYPGDEKQPKGKLRLMYEANPLGFVAERAGGAASTGGQRILGVIPENLHERTPLILGNKDVVERTVSIINRLSRS